MVKVLYICESENYIIEINVPIQGVRDVEMIVVVEKREIEMEKRLRTDARGLTCGN